MLVPALALEPVAEVPRTGWTSGRKLALAAGGTGVVLAAIGAGLGAYTLSQKNDSKPHCSTGTPPEW